MVLDWKSVFATRNARLKASEIRELLKLLDQPDIISFAGGIPDPALFPAPEFQSVFSDILGGSDHETALQYSPSEGHEGLRLWLVDHMRGLGIACDLDNIFITSGSQQALDYLGKLMLSPRDTALVNWPTYLGALGAFNAYEPEYDRLFDRTNRTAADFKETAAQKGGAVKFAYLSVDFANPTGETLDVAARDAILNLATDMDIAIIEDAAYQSLRYDGQAHAPILARELKSIGDINQCRTIYCGSFSKTLAPGLRIGWVCAAKTVVSQLVLIKQASDLHTPTLNQMAIAKFAKTGFDAQVSKVRTAYRARRDCMLSALDQFMPDGVHWTKPEGGMFIWITLPEHLDGAVLLEQSLKTQRVAFVPGQAFFADGSGVNTLRLSFSKTDEKTIQMGIKRLGQLLCDQMAAS